MTSEALRESKISFAECKKTRDAPPGRLVKANYNALK